MPMEEEEVLKRPVNQSRAESRQIFSSLAETESGSSGSLYELLGFSVALLLLIPFLLLLLFLLYLLLLRIYKFSVCFSYTFAAASQTEAGRPGRQSR